MDVDVHLCDLKSSVPVPCGVNMNGLCEMNRQDKIPDVLDD